MSMSKRSLLGRSDGSTVHYCRTDSTDLGDVLAMGLGDGPALE